MSDAIRDVIGCVCAVLLSTLFFYVLLTGGY
ncbi:membrane protein [Gordonia phage Kudefre]|uniref:Membrane protein n=1 Tax=Gordonia phage Kudefre TaxID=2885975 RepID=A0AAE8Y940_9CAUD|nr:membrane protein [Gordonia phage Kudefre]UDL15364.1 membrane protein [Gordonia phage Kudefre]